MNYSSMNLRKVASNRLLVLFCTTMLIFSGCKQNSTADGGVAGLQVPDGYVIEEVVSTDLSLSARAMSVPQLSDSEFGLLLDYMGAGL